ncbi:hypothetical protein HDU85_000772 [Gaertneriomyces sp. JEL0708]|nr:hypothetical protein HDU85_000772 [Gaertneriomyces sp. JEL0708]
MSEANPDPVANAQDDEQVAMNNPYLAHLVQPKRNQGRRKAAKAFYKGPPVRNSSNEVEHANNHSNARMRTAAIPQKPGRPSKEEEAHNKRPRPANSLGNYSGYYTTRLASLPLDPRMAILAQLNDHHSCFTSKRVLDIGCNTGHITIAAAQFFDPQYVEGLDIDPALIRKARREVAERSSLMDPRLAESSESPTAMETDEDPSFTYFPRSVLTMIGPLPIIDPISEPSHPHAPPPRTFPHNIHFRTTDFLGEPNASSPSQMFDTILALSLTKHIHLNHGDLGLRHFFKRCFLTLKKGGMLILEPQLFENYKKRGVEWTPDMWSHYREATIRTEENFVNELKKVGFKTVEKVAEGQHVAKRFRRVFLACTR